MSTQPSRFDERRFTQLARGQGLSLGQPLSAVALTGSTNDDAMAAAREGAPHGACFVADQQHSGRGRRARRWISTPGRDLLTSLVLRPELDADRLSALTLLTGLAVRQAAAARVTRPVRVKWPNDVIAVSRKLAGVLLESRREHGQLEAVVVGIGINVTSTETEHPPRAAPHMTSLAMLGGSRLDRESLLVDLLAGIEQRLSSLQHDGLPPLIAELTEHDALRNRWVRVDTMTGIAEGFGPDGALRVRQASGKIAMVRSGTITLLDSPPPG